MACLTFLDSRVRGDDGGFAGKTVVSRASRRFRGNDGGFVQNAS